jgi:hypothetical protein
MINPLLLAPQIERPAPAFLTGGAKQLMIDGDLVPALSGETLASIDPTTEQTLTSFAAAPLASPA